MSNNPRIFTLLEVSQSVQRTLAARYASSFWVRAEMNKLNHYAHSGHCYPEMVEKTDGKIVAQMRANLWKSDFERINANFLKVLKEPLKDGIHILFNASIQFDPVYGLALRIHDIDPSYSLGELEREKAQTIERLRNEGIFDSNQKLLLPVLPQRIAVISVETSKGYADFTNVIDRNPWGYRFFHMLFPALLQGDKAVESIMFQLDRIKKVCGHFDAVAIIRGGGGDVGLSCYNHYELSRGIATFPIPVISGIGHSTNETVVELVAHHNAITPTALADLLIQRFHNFAVPVKDAVVALRQKIPVIIESHHKDLKNLSKELRQLSLNALQRSRGRLSSTAFLLNRSIEVRNAIGRSRIGELQLRMLTNAMRQVQVQRRELEFLISSLPGQVGMSLRKHHDRLELTTKSIQLCDPVNVIKRGYSLTTHHGKLIRSITDVGENDVIETRVSDGTIISKVHQTDRDQ